MNETPAGAQGLNPYEQGRALDAAMDLLSEEGLRPTIVEKIAERSGISVTRIYLHFGGTEKLIRALLHRELELIAGAVPVPELRFPGETLRDELEVLGRILLLECRTHLGFLRTMLTEAIRNPEFAPIFYETFILRGRKLFTEFLTMRMERGELRPDTDIEAAAAFFLSGLTFSLLLMELFGGKFVEQVDDDRLVKSMVEVFLAGILVSKSRNGK